MCKIRSIGIRTETVCHHTETTKNISTTDMKSRNYKILVNKKIKFTENRHL